MTAKILQKKKKFPAIVWKEDDLYIARCLAVEVCSQGNTKKQALQNLAEAIELYLEDGTFEMPPKIQRASVEQVEVSYA